MQQELAVSKTSRPVGLDQQQQNKQQAVAGYINR